MPRLYDYVLDDGCYKARLLMSILGVAHETTPIDVFPGRQQQSAAFRAINPLGTLPVLEDDGVVVCGAEPVLWHLANKYDAFGTWLPRDQALFGPVAQWLAFASGAMRPLSEARLVSMMGEPGDIDTLRLAGRGALRLLDDRLADRAIDGHDWLVTDTPTIADLACFTHAALAHDCGIGSEDYPAINLWQRRIRKLPGFLSMPGIPGYF